MILGLAGPIAWRDTDTTPMSVGHTIPTHTTISRLHITTATSSVEHLAKAVFGFVPLGTTRSSSCLALPLTSLVKLVLQY